MNFFQLSLLGTGIALATSVMSTAFAATTGTIAVQGLIQDNVTCNLHAGDVNRTIRLDTYPVGSVPASNQSFGYTPTFTLTADCSSNATQVSFLFSGTPSAGDGLRFQNAGDATGLGLQLESGDGKLIPANGKDSDRTRTLNVTNGTATLDLKAAYYRQAPVKAGSFESKVMVSLSYN
ncbi:fimbrial protein [Dyella sp.]|uniref:fimbrial protein n=1 Tax=Dyella sp. TaxID=1869338 RepID=UPI002FD8C323